MSNLILFSVAWCLLAALIKKTEFGEKSGILTFGGSFLGAVGIVIAGAIISSPGKPELRMPAASPNPAERQQPIQPVSQNLPTSPIKFEVAKARYVGTFHKFQGLSITNRSSTICKNALIVVNEYYSAPLSRTYSNIPTMEANKNSPDIPPDEKVIIANPASVNSNFLAEFRDGKDRGPKDFDEIRQIKIQCEGGVYEATF